MSKPAPHISRAALQTGTWVVVCDGAKALILQNVGDEQFPNLQMRKKFQGDSAPTREQGTDAPGRFQAAVGSSRSAVEQTDWHEQSERAFLRNLALHLDEAVAGGLAKSLVIVAPPRALGVLREQLSKPAREAVRAELARDYINVPAHEIEKRLLDLAAT